MIWLCLVVALVAAPPSDALADSDFRLETERPERGHYRLWASETLQVRAERLLEVLSQSRCKAGCDAVADHVAIDEVLERRPTSQGEDLVSWTFIDSLIDASYFSLVEVVRGEGRIVRRSGTAPPDVVNAWQSPERKHDPLFHTQGVVWTLTEEFNAEGTFLHTRVEVEMAMHSDRFLVNLAPGRVLAGAGEHLRAIFVQMRELEGHRLSPAGVHTPAYGLPPLRAHRPHGPPDGARSQTESQGADQPRSFHDRRRRETCGARGSLQPVEEACESRLRVDSQYVRLARCIFQSHLALAQREKRAENRLRLIAHSVDGREPL